MATPKSVWGIDIGQVALKALKLTVVEGEIQVEAFDIIEHPKILSQPDADRRQLIRNALEQFLARNSVNDAALAVAVPGQTSFTRFVKLPPVEEKRIPDIVRFEAEQQIPFPINDVIWRYQTFKDPDSPDVELGIFAMKKVDVAEMLSHFSDMELPVDLVQMAPLALYNFMTADQQIATDGATLLADVGADKTDLAVADGPRIWNRTIPIGGNNFTEALVRAFKLPFPKAEKLKRTAASSKYARQIFQAMRPVFADLVQEIQRSIGFYTATHRETRFKRVLGLGNGFRLPGLQKFMEQNLNIPVVRIDSYNRIAPTSTVNAPAFTENVLSFAVSYGLALQGLGQTLVSTNLLPQEVARKHLWTAKKPWFIGAAAAVLVAMGLYVFRAYVDNAGLAPSNSLTDTRLIVQKLEGFKADDRKLVDQSGDQVKQIEANYKLTAYQYVLPAIQEIISKQLSDQFVEQWKLSAMGSAPDEGAFNKVQSELAGRSRASRQLVFVMSQHPVFQTDIDGKRRPGFVVTVDLRSPLARLAVDEKLTNLRQSSLGTIGGLEVISFRPVSYGTPSAPPPVAVGVAPGAASATPVAGSLVGKKDPLFPNEDMANDTIATVEWKIAIPDDGVVVPDDKAAKGVR